MQKSILENDRLMLARRYRDPIMREIARKKLDHREEYLRNKNRIILSVQHKLRHVMPDEIREHDVYLFHGMKDEDSVWEDYREAVEAAHEDAGDFFEDIPF